MTMVTITKVIREYVGEYLQADKERKGEILSHVCFITRMHRKSAIRKFRHLQMKDPSREEKRGRSTFYTADVTVALKDVWEAGGEALFERVGVSSLEEAAVKNTTMLISWYGSRFYGRKTANGETFSKYRFTAAHRELPFGTILYLVNPENRRWAIVRINDRGPFWKDRELDVSFGAAKALGVVRDGVVELESYIMPEREKPKTVFVGN